MEGRYIYKNEVKSMSLMKIPEYSHAEIEDGVLKYWEEHEIYAKSKKKGKGKQKFYYLDGPPYTSGRVHIGQAWGKGLRDMAMRYKRMAGFDVWDRAGFDMHGLPTEKQVMKKFNLKFKEDVYAFGLDKFNTECAKFATENMQYMIRDFKRLGVWMDFENPYQPIKSTFIEGVWWLVKKAHETDRLYEGERTLPWCYDCATSLFKHELEYKNVMDDSIFVKFKVAGKENEYLIIWTTTPWTIPFNLGIMVNPELEYVRAKVENEVWILAKGLAGPVVQAVAEKRFEIIEEFHGDKLDGLEYEHPFYDTLRSEYDRLKSESKRVHTVLLSSEYVTLDAGTGLVHCAPGCGPEDYEVGREYGIPPYNMLDQYGFYPNGMGEFSGKHAKKQNKDFTESLRRRGVLIAETPVEHEYAHCWRCHNPVVFRTTRQWFFKVEDLKEKMKKLNAEVKWVPDWAGNKQFDSWLTNLRDNSITRQNVWGVPVPIWKCSHCGHVEVIGSMKELSKHAEVPDNLHRPWIDNVTWKHKCKDHESGEMKRLVDVLDVWIDAGTNSWTCLDYPQTDKNFKRLFPADFILEGKDQIRGWFNVLLVASMIGFNKHPYKAVYMHGFINDALGRKMSKSEGNYILPEEYVKKYGADALRAYMSSGANPGIDMNFNEDDLKVHSRNLVVLWNLHRYVIDQVMTLEIDAKTLNAKRSKSDFDVEERFMLSKLHSGLKNITELYEEYRLNEIPLAIEELFLTLSRTYVQMVREKLAAGSEKEKENAAYTLYRSLLEIIKAFAPVCPLMCEAIYQNMRPLGLKEESIFLLDWPSYDDRMIDRQLEHHMETMSGIAQGILSARETAQLGVRWPLREVLIVTSDEKVIAAVESLKDLLRKQVNVKEVSIMPRFTKVDVKVKVDFEKLGPDFGAASPKVIARLALDSPQSVLQHIEKAGKYVVTVDGKEYNVVREHIIVSRAVPSNYAESEFRGGFAYLKITLDAELESEGYSRELIRRIQSARKKAGLEKTNIIRLFVKTDRELVEMLKPHEKLIKEKVGASLMALSDNNPAYNHDYKVGDKIKTHQVEISLSKVQ
jgi:isoleucyl-tRNA synthetase